MSCRLETVPGIGVIGATGIASTVTDPSNFKSGRDFAAWLRQRSEGQRADRGHLQAGRSLSPTAARYRCNRRCSTRPAAAAQSSLDYEAVGQEFGQARRRCGFQQDSTYRLGDHGLGRTIERRSFAAFTACCKIKASVLAGSPDVTTVYSTRSPAWNAAPLTDGRTNRSGPPPSGLMKPQ